QAAAWPGRKRKRARLYPHRHRARTGAGTRTSRSERSAQRSTPVTPVYLVDSSLYIFRAWHSMPMEFDDRDGNPVNAVHGFTRFVLDLLERQKPVRLAFAFDESLETNFRNDLYPAYKANREPAPEELRRQFGYCRQLCRALGFVTLANGRYE